MPNHLVTTNSPYLLEHANNPVDWYPWGPEALDKARGENKPIFLSIGYAACHWCHVMAHESFENPDIAKLLNEHFVSIKVDREERPDLDDIYMTATQALTGSGGWPMSVFLTPELKPFYAGTYFPPVRRYNLPSFGELLQSLAETWEKQPEEIERVAQQVVEHIQPKPIGTSTSISEAELETASRALLDAYDWGYGGWGGAPKFPQPMLIEFLLRRVVEGAPEAEQALKAVQHNLRAMARGGMYDVVGGGFARYSTDNLWRVPHFEKMLYDNAQLARAYLHAWRVTGEAAFRDVTVATLDFIQRELTDPAGGFYSSLDADSEGEEGKFYVWTSEEIRAVLGGEQDAELFATAYGVTERGNWEGNTVLQRALDDASVAAKVKMSIDEVRKKLAECRARLLEVREQRIRPPTDDKVLTAWNGLALQAFAEAARYLDDSEKRAGYTDMATRNAVFLLQEMQGDAGLYRSWRQGRTGTVAFLEDYAALILGLLDLYQVDFDVRWFSEARRLADDMLRLFADPAGGFYDTGSQAEALLIRPKDLQDNATPSGNALACEALLRLAAFTESGEYRDRAEQSLGMVAEPLLRFPTAFGRWLSAADLALQRVKQIALLAGASDGLTPMLEVVNGSYRPNAAVAAAVYPPPQGTPALLADRPLLNGQATAYVCEHFVCRQPVNSPTDLQSLL